MRGYLGQFLLGMCRWPLRAPSPLQSILWRTDNFRSIKIQPKTIDLSTRLWGITRVYGVYSPEPRTEVDCSRLNFNISKSVYHRLHLGHFWANMEFSRSNLVTFCLSMYLLLNKEHSLR